MKVLAKGAQMVWGRTELKSNANRRQNPCPTPYHHQCRTHLIVLVHHALTYVGRDLKVLRQR